MEAALSAAVADGVIPSFNDDGKKVDQQQPPVLENRSAPNIQLVSNYNPEMEMLNQYVGNGMVKIDPTSLMAAAAAQSQASVEAQPLANPLRRGKWTVEEEAYANRLIQEFKAGLLPLTDGTTLRTFLSKLLNCDPMRISKKFVGSNCIGKQVFRRRGADLNNLTPDEIEQTRLELSELERKFLDRVAQNKGSRGGGGGGASKKTSGEMSSSRGGGGRSAAAVGRALLLGNNAPQTNVSQGSASVEAGGLLAQLQAENPGMFDNNTAGSYLGGGSQTGGLGKMICYHIFYSLFLSSRKCSRITSPPISIIAFPGNTNPNVSITNPMLHSGMSRDQITLLAGKGISSSVSLANMFSKNRSFDQLMSLDFQSMQSIDNLANLIQSMPNTGRVPKAQMKNVEWGNQWAGASAPGPSLYGEGAKGSIENLVRVLSGDNNVMGDTNNVRNNANATNFTNYLQGAAHQGNNLAGDQMAPSNDLTDFIKSLTQQQHNQQYGNNSNYRDILQNMASGNVGGNSLHQNKNSNIVSGVNQNLGGSNDMMNIPNQSGQSAANFSQRQSFNPFMQQLNTQFGGTSHGNPMMQYLAQAGELIICA
jgi:hypothetical protein